MDANGGNDLRRRPEPETRGGRRLSRRRFLWEMPVIGAGALVTFTGLPRLWPDGQQLQTPGVPRRTVGEAETVAARQWVMVFDLRKCDGCNECTKACREQHHLPEQQEWIKVYELEGVSGQKYYMPRTCMMCENASCVRVCPVRATYRDLDGAVLVDQQRCIGCRMCMAACPYEARYFNWGDPPAVPNTLGEARPEFPVPQQKGTVGKCVFCVHNLRFGKLPACVTSCSMEAIYIGDLNQDLMSNGIRSMKLSQFLRENDAVRFKEELNTRPRVYYILGHGQDLEF